MADDPKEYGRTTPPKGPDEWAAVWAAVEKAEKSWLITGPIHAVVTNWRALLVIGVVVLWINNPRIRAALEVITGQGQ